MALPSGVSGYPCTLTISLLAANGTVVTKTYTVTAGFEETADEKVFTGKRSGETTTGVITINKKMIFDEKIETA